MAERSSAPRRSAAVAFERPKSAGDWKKALGRKVSLRYRLHDDPDHAYSEAIGFVQSVAGEPGATSISIVNKHGETRVVALRDVEAAKLFPK